MNHSHLSRKGLSLLQMYQQMARDGYDRSDGDRVENAFSDFELTVYREDIRKILQEFEVATVLDYGCGGANWNLAGFDQSDQTACEYFGLDGAYRYEPARDIDERQQVDCVISFDVLEHIWILDVPAVLREMFSYAGKLLVLNIACYPAAALLPDGENAHVTIRDSIWWKGMCDSISIEYPDVSVYLICSKGWRDSAAFPIWNAGSWDEGE